MMQKSSLSNFCLTKVRNLKVFLEVQGRDIDFAKSEKKKKKKKTSPMLETHICWGIQFGNIELICYSVGVVSMCGTARFWFKV